MIIGNSINPGLMVNDYSGIANAGALQGQASAQFGKDLGGAISSGVDIYQSMKAQEGQMSAFGKSMDAMAKAFPAQADFYNQAKSEIFDPNASMIERAGRMQGYQGMMQNMFAAQKMQQQDEMNRMRMMQMGQAGGAGGGAAPVAPPGSFRD
jgi:hypothetical protein